MTTVVAPGKLMIAGEYSVLAGGEALAMAVEPGVEAAAEPSEVWELARADSHVSWREGWPVPEDLRFAHAALVAAREELGEPMAPLRIVTRTLGGVATGGGKPGAGGSASATVAVVGAVFLAAGHALRDHAILGPALRSHLAAQGGRGSGYDIATIVYGGLIRWRPAQVAAAGAHAPAYEAARLPWPEGLHVLAGYTGRSASTSSFLAALDRAALADRAGLAAELHGLGARVTRLIDAFAAADVRAVLDGVRDCHAALCAWDRERRLGVMPPEVAQAIALAEACGAAAKVSGAGGGDSVLAFAPDAATLAAVASAWRDRGFDPLPFRRCEVGLHEKIPDRA